VIMSLVGFEQGLNNPESAITGLRIFYTGLPILGTLMAMWVMNTYDIDEKRAAENRAKLATRKAEA